MKFLWSSLSAGKRLRRVVPAVLHYLTLWARSQVYKSCTCLPGIPLCQVPGTYIDDIGCGFVIVLGQGRFVNWNASMQVWHVECK